MIGDIVSDCAFCNSVISVFKGIMFFTVRNIPAPLSLRTELVFQCRVRARARVCVFVCVCVAFALVCVFVLL